MWNRHSISVCLAALFLLGSLNISHAYDEPTAEPSAVAPSESQPENLIETAKEKVDTISKELDQSPEAQKVSAGILDPIYQVAEKLSFPSFHWVAFALMATGTVSYALQLVLGKLVVLSKMSFSFSEVLSDLLGLAISVLGLVLTTQAAAENSTFTTSAAAVISASGTGLVAGFIFYLWGQAQEIAAVKGRQVKQAVAAAEKK